MAHRAKTKIPISISIKETLNDRIEYLGKETGLSKSYIIESAIENGIDQVSSSLFRMRPRSQPVEQQQAQTTAQPGKLEETVTA